VGTDKKKVVEVKAHIAATGKYVREYGCVTG
jgi:hypothetical protein